MTIPNTKVQVHELIKGVGRESKKPFFALKCLNDNGDNRYITFFVTEDMYNSIEKTFTVDKAYTFDFEYNVYNNKGSMRVVKILK